MEFNQAMKDMFQKYDSNTFDSEYANFYKNIMISHINVLKNHYIKLVKKKSKLILDQWLEKLTNELDELDTFWVKMKIIMSRLYSYCQYHWFDSINENAYYMQAETQELSIILMSVYIDSEYIKHETLLQEYKRLVSSISK